jgi:hypothetical protein
MHQARKIYENYRMDDIRYSSGNTQVLSDWSQHKMFWIERSFIDTGSKFPMGAVFQHFNELSWRQKYSEIFFTFFLKSHSNSLSGPIKKNWKIENFFPARTYLNFSVICGIFVHISPTSYLRKFQKFAKKSRFFNFSPYFEMMGLWQHLLPADTFARTHSHVGVAHTPEHHCVFRRSCWFADLLCAHQDSFACSARVRTASSILGAHWTHTGWRFLTWEMSKIAIFDSDNHLTVEFR